MIHHVSMPVREPECVGTGCNVKLRIGLFVCVLLVSCSRSEGLRSDSTAPSAVVATHASDTRSSRGPDRVLSWDDPLDPVVITTDGVASGRFPVLRVVHQAGQGGWQFYDDRDPVATAVAVPKTEILLRDPGLGTVTDLPGGWEAERDSIGAQWVRRRADADRG